MQYRAAYVHWHVLQRLQYGEIAAKPLAVAAKSGYFLYLDRALSTKLPSEDTDFSNGLQGQHNLPSCKLNVYDNTVRIPMLIRGPGIRAKQRFTQIGSNVDVAPTLLALAGLDPTQLTPPMDGKSLLPWLLSAAAADDSQMGGRTVGQADHDQNATLPSATRTQLVVERSRLGVVGPVDDAESLPRVRAAHWIEFYSLGNLHMCGGGICSRHSILMLSLSPSMCVSLCVHVIPMVWLSNIARSRYVQWVRVQHI